MPDFLYIVCYAPSRTPKGDICGQELVAANPNS